MTTLRQKLPALERSLFALEGELGNLETLSSDGLIEVFQACAMITGDLAEGRHEPEIEKRRIDAENRFRRIMSNLGAKIISRGPEAQEAFLNLLVHADPWVRLQCASHALAFAPERSESALNELHKLHGIIGAEASLALHFALGRSFESLDPSRNDRSGG